MAAAFLCSFWSVLNAKNVGFWGSAPDPDGGAHSAPPYPLAGREGCPASRTLPGASPLAPPLLLSPSDATVYNHECRLWADVGTATEHTTISISCYELYRTYGSSMANKVQRYCARALQLGVARLDAVGLRPTRTLLECVLYQTEV